MKKSIFLFFAAILCATSAWGSTKFVAGDVLFYDFTDVPNNGGVNWAYSAGNLVYDPIGAGKKSVWYSLIHKLGLLLH